MVNHLALSIIQAHDPEKEEGGEDRGQGYAPLHVARPLPHGPPEMDKYQEL